MSKQLIDEVSKLEINDGDTIILRGAFPVDDVKTLVRTLHKHGKEKITVMLLQEGQTVETLCEDQMRECGWIRVGRDTHG